MSARPTTPADRAASSIIEATRQERGMSKAELVRRSGVPKETLANYLSGERAMTVGTYRALVEALAIPPEIAARKLADLLLSAEYEE